MLAANGIHVTSIIVYQNVKAEISLEMKKNVIEKLFSNEIKIIAFFSPSAVNNFVESFPDLHSYPHLFIATIGETTKKAASAKGLQVHIVPRKPTAAHMAQSILDYTKKI